MREKLEKKDKQRNRNTTHRTKNNSSGKNWRLESYRGNHARDDGSRGEDTAKIVNEIDV